MLKIAYCDDCPRDRAKIMASLSNIEERWKEVFVMQSFDSGEALCEDLKQNSYDIILLDIVMSAMDGIETARTIRSMGESSKLIFISSYDDKIRELFQHGTIAFIDKPFEVEVLENALQVAHDIIKKDENEDRVFSYKKHGQLCFVPTKDILYFITHKNQVEIVTCKTQLIYADQIKNVWNIMSKNKEFIMPNQSYIFNLKHIMLKSNMIFLKSGLRIRSSKHSKIDPNHDMESVNISRNYKDETCKRYMNYVEQRSE